MFPFRPARLLVFLFLLGFCTPGWSREPVAEFRAGAARKEITPREPVPMWGYSARRDALSTGTMDPLYADALVLAAAGKKLAIVGLDLGRSPVERSLRNIRKRLREEAAIEYSLIAGSHTHHGPVLELDRKIEGAEERYPAAVRYSRQLEEWIVEAVLEADARLTAVRLAVGSRPLEGFNRNRHTRLEPRPRDPDLAVLSLEDTSGKPLAVVVNFAAHPTMIPAEQPEFSADFVGALKKTVEEGWGGLTVFMQGAAGDLATDRGGRADFREFGRALGEEVLRLLSSLSYQSATNPSIQFRETRFGFSSRTDLTSPLVRSAYERAFFPEIVAHYVEEYRQGIRPRLSVAVLNGEVALVGVSGEFFSNHAVRLKERARVGQLFFFGYCNGYHQYFPTIEAVAEGGYGADALVSPVAVGAGEQIMNRALVWIYEMLGGG